MVDGYMPESDSSLLWLLVSLFLSHTDVVIAFVTVVVRKEPSVDVQDQRMVSFLLSKLGEGMVGMVLYHLN